MKSGRMKRILLSVIAFLFVGCSIAGGTVLLSNSSISDSNRGGDSTPSENEIIKNAPTNSDLWTNGHYATAFDNEGEAGIDGTTEEKAYEIRTAEQLALLAYRINTSSTNSTYRSLYYVQTADIDLSLHYWDAIGTENYYFRGHYDGGGYEISGLFTQPGSTDDYSYQGLFGYVRGGSSYATVHDVTIIDSNIQGYEYVGGVVGEAYYSTITNCYNAGDVTGSGRFGGVVGSASRSTITNCYNTGDVTGSGEYVGGVVGFAGSSVTITNSYNAGTVDGSRLVGGVVGSSYYHIYNCYNTGTVDGSSQVGGVVGKAQDYSTITNSYNAGTVDGSYYIGGVVGEAQDYSTVTNSYNIGDVTGSINYVGGVVGWASRSTITNCYNTGTISGSGHPAGGVVGEAQDYSTITNCYNNGEVIVSGSDVGGVVGDAITYSAITNCYNTGTVDGSSQAGGVVGNTSKSTVTNCYNTGKVTGDNWVGGVVGNTSSNSTITNCYNTGAVTGDNDVGGVVGYAYSNPTITNCYNTGSVSGSGEVGGVVGSAYSSTVTNCYYGGNCTLSYGIGNSSSNTGASKDENLIANAKSLSWYQDSSKWISRYPWDFEEVWSLVPSANDGYPILQGFSVNITYNSNFGENEVITEQVPSGQEIVIAGYDLFTRVGYEISHWNTKPDGTGLNFYAGDTYSEGAGLTLYAIWEAGIYSVTLDANGGSGGTSAIYLKYDSGWYSSSSCTSSSKITALPSTPTRTGYEFKGYSTEPDGSGTLAVSATGAINVSDTFYSTDGTRTWYAVWEARNPAYYDSEGGFWYVENGKLPQSKVGESLKATLSGQWSSLTEGSVYYMGVEELAENDLTSDGGMQSKVYNGEEYVKFNGEYYLVEPIRWRLVYSSSQQEGYAVENTSVLATMAEIVFVGSYSSAKIGVGAGYSAESVTMLLKNQVSDEFLVNENREVEIFRAPKDTTSVSGSVFVASSEELANFTTSKNNTTGSGVKAGKVSLSDFVKDYLRATGQGEYYFTRDLGDQLNTILCLNPVGDRSQAKAQQTLGVQFTIKVTEYACKEM